jgi:hypothetical protein
MISSAAKLHCFATPAQNSEDGGTPAQIALEGDRHPIVGAFTPAAIARQQQVPSRTIR